MKVVKVAKSPRRDIQLADTHKTQTKHEDGWLIEEALYTHPLYNSIRNELIS